MSKIYADYEDKYVKNTIIHARKEDNGAFMAYKDESYTEPYTSVELIDAYLKGAIICFRNYMQGDDSRVGYAIPVWAQIDNNFAFVYFHYDANENLSNICAPDPKMMQ